MTDQTWQDHSLLSWAQSFIKNFLFLKLSENCVFDVEIRKYLKNFFVFSITVLLINWLHVFLGRKLTIKYFPRICVCVQSWKWFYKYTLNQLYKNRFLTNLSKLIFQSFCWHGVIIGVTYSPKKLKLIPDKSPISHTNMITPHNVNQSQGAVKISLLV